MIINNDFPDYLSYLGNIRESNDSEPFNQAKGNMSNIFRSEILMRDYLYLKLMQPEPLDILADERGADLREVTAERLLEGLDELLRETAERDLFEMPEFLLTVEEGFLLIVVPDLRDIRLVLLTERLE